MPMFLVGRPFFVSWHRRFGFQQEGCHTSFGKTTGKLKALAKREVLMCNPVATQEENARFQEIFKFGLDDFPIGEKREPRTDRPGGKPKLGQRLPFFILIGSGTGESDEVVN